MFRLYPIGVLLFLVVLGESLAYYPPRVPYWESLSERDLDVFIRTIEAEHLALNAVAANITMDEQILEITEPKVSGPDLEKFTERKRAWLENVCAIVKKIPRKLLTKSQHREFVVLCRGAIYTRSQLDLLNLYQGQMYTAYLSSTICLNDSTCLHMEPELERLLSESPYNPELYKSAWIKWHDLIGRKTRDIFPKFVAVLNLGARRNHYHDVGETWREELEIDNLEYKSFEWYAEIEPIYKAMHAAVRYALRKEFPSEIPDPYGLIPEHLLGSMWGYDWTPVLSFVLKDQYKVQNWTKILEAREWSVLGMAEKAEDYYVSMGFPKMTKKFWKNSNFVKKSNATLSCHGTAVNMYWKDDFRLIMCGDLTLHDFYVLHHEMGHIEYYMAYENQSTILQEGLNSAFHEAIGDTIMLGVMSPYHLYRLGLITDEQLKDKSFNQVLLMSQAFARIPHIGYGLTIDKYRWDIFSGAIPEEDYNKEFWRLNAQIRGVEPPVDRDETTFDAAAKFHVIDNTPYIRYFLSHIIQVQMFKAMCEIELYGTVLNDGPFPYQLSNCDLYGARKAGKRLQELMRFGASKTWSEVYPIVVGTNEISTEALREYYNPVYQWLLDFIEVNNIPVGWKNEEDESNYWF